MLGKAPKDVGRLRATIALRFRRYMAGHNAKGDYQQQGHEDLVGGL